MPDVIATPAAPTTGAPAAGGAPKAAAAPAAKPAPGGEPAPAAGAPNKAVPAPGEGASKPGEPAGAAELTPAEKRKYKFEIDGAEIEHEFTDEEARVHIQRGLGAGKRMQEAVQALRQVEEFVGMLKDPARLPEVLGHPSIGLNVDEWVRNYVAEQIKLANMDPKERQFHEMQKKYEKQQAEMEAMRRAEYEKDVTQKTQEARERLLGDIRGVIDTAGLPKSDYIIRRMARAMQDLREQVGRPVKAAEVVDIVRRQYEEELRHVLGASQDSALFSFLGEENVNRIRQEDLRRVNGGGQPTGGLPPPPLPPKPRESVGFEDLDEQLARAGAL
jgi:hypothetical protein